MVRRRRPPGVGCPAAWCPWVPFGVRFAGGAQSVDFGGVADYIGFDDVTLGSAVPGSTVPEPATVLRLGAGLAGLGVVARRRRTA